ncbi:MAG: FkbM family methyltransferase [Oligoflexia bacterium]|nr:FkbM family methyltransferase [Oligoflexia bacterium]
MNIVKNLCYSLIDLATFNRGVPVVINGTKINFPAKYCRYYKKDYESKTANFLKNNCKRGDVVIDIGSHLGYFSVLTSKLVHDDGKVFSFEPTSATNKMQKKVIKMNKCKNIELKQAVVGKVAGKTKFYEFEDNVSVANSLVDFSSDEDGKKKCIEYDLVSIDSFVVEQKLTKLDLIKIDAEGAEIDILLGGKSAFQRFRPRVAIDVHPPQIKAKGDSLEDFWKIIKTYNMTMISNGKKVDRLWFCSQKDLLKTFEVFLYPS